MGPYSCPREHLGLPLRLENIMSQVNDNIQMLKYFVFAKLL